MVRFKCNRCGKIVEFLRLYNKNVAAFKCSCGGSLQPVNENIDNSYQGGVLDENRHAGKKWSS